jgi:hypothetical protein
MELLAEPQPTLAWVCAECGHGSPEPRDQQAHLDAHRQLRQFFREWDAGAAAHHRSRRPLVLGCAALLIALVLAVLALLRVSDGGEVPPSARPGPPGPAANAPPAVQPPRAGPPPASAGPSTATPGRSDPSTAGSAGRSAPVPTPSAGADAGIAPPRAPAGAAAAVLPPVPTIPPAAAAAPAGLSVQGCLLVVCVEVGS